VNVLIYVDGGPADGRWVEVRGDTRVLQVPDFTHPDGMVRYEPTADTRNEDGRLAQVWRVTAESQNGHIGGSGE
jgi:hypothetical protein